MDTYIVRQPILDRDQKLVAYEIVYQQDSSALYNQRDSRVANAIISFFRDVNTTSFLGGKEAFLTFTPNLLMRDVPEMFDPEKLIIQVEDNILVNPEAKQILQGYKNRGFRVALKDFDFNKRYLDILPAIDYMKVDFSEIRPDVIATRLELARKYGMKTCAFNVNTTQTRELALAYCFDYFQGNCVAEMVRSRVRKIEHLHSNFFRLMTAISREVPNFDEIAEIISLDVTLTFSLLRIVNSAYFALPNRVKDIKQALTVLGLTQLRHWVYLLSLSANEDLSGEVIKTSFLRAVFCQELSEYISNMPISRSEVYLLGMFSTLDVLLEVDMEDALAELPVDKAIKTALIGGEGVCADLLSLCVCYEKSEWSRVGKAAEALNIPLHVIGNKYLEALEYVDETWRELSIPRDTV